MVFLLEKNSLNSIGAKIGDKVSIISSENKEIKFEIEGVFQSGYYDYDINMVILPKSCTVPNLWRGYII